MSGRRGWCPETGSRTAGGAAQSDATCEHWSAWAVRREQRPDGPSGTRPIDGREGENVAERYGDRPRGAGAGFALQSHTRALRRSAKGRFADRAWCRSRGARHRPDGRDPRLWSTWTTDPAPTRRSRSCLALRPAFRAAAHVHGRQTRSRSRRWPPASFWPRGSEPRRSRPPARAHPWSESA